ncbi:uncharacterized protein BDZ99DRAFT_576476 [Mytilinidion resinicola]|uniref:Uncharacterized protein n=1 Tax=Mytilinidion resinicola TaxID=574789 RepID=A0A6A6Y233_9PEZI|nr:uncharacterized protein BDZ99DRAFT_576476 [Mytilinidion resinicola]KAF2802876.1 hypothetical protein BDZ99DRAFT_576476 [Mytilinidion resinicola]
MPGKRPRSTCSASSPATAPEASRPANDWLALLRTSLFIVTALLTSPAVLQRPLVLESAACAPSTLLPCNTCAARVRTPPNVNKPAPSTAAPPLRLTPTCSLLNKADITAITEKNREQEPLPHAQAIIDTRRAALKEYILFRGEGSSGGIKGLTEGPELLGSLARPQPYSCIGYITTTGDDTHPHSPCRLPAGRMAWLTSTFRKAAIFDENQVHASLQAARDGALLINYMHDFYSLAYPIAPPRSSRRVISP